LNHEWFKTGVRAGSRSGITFHVITGNRRFAVPALAALVAGDNSLWAWPALILLVFPIAIVFATLGRHFPSAGGVAHFVNMAFGPRLARVTGWLFLSVIPVGYPRPCTSPPALVRRFWLARQPAAAGRAGNAGDYLVGRFSRSQLQRQSTNAGCRADCRPDRRHLVARRDKPAQIPFPPPAEIDSSQLFPRFR
jgi:amino acid efflux transporter